MRRASSDVERALRQVPCLRDSFRIDHADHDRDAVLLEALESSELPDRYERAVDIQRVESLALGPTRNIGVKSFPCFHHRCENFERTAPRPRGCRFDLFHDRSQTLLFDRQIAVRTKLRSSFGEQ